MLKILKFEELERYPALRETMFKDRAAQFVERLGWDIDLTEDGLEIDAYDDANALYLIAHDTQGRHEASMRLRPMLGRTLLEDIFPRFMPHCDVSPQYWESTRFCVAAGGSRAGALRVLLSGQQLGLAQGLIGAWGIYDLKMERVYRRLGWYPDRVAEMDDPSGRIALGCWRFEAPISARLHSGARIGKRATDFWVRRAGGDVPIFT